MTRRDEEITLQGLFLLALPHHLPHLRVFRRNIGAAKTRRGNFISFGITGQADTYAICDGGRHIEIELKALHGRLSAEQKVWRQWCFDHRVPYMLAIEKKDESHESTVARWIEELRALAG